jgi:hypothetical protein
VESPRAAIEVKRIARDGCWTRLRGKNSCLELWDAEVDVETLYIHEYDEAAERIRQMVLERSAS